MEPVHTPLRGRRKPRPDTESPSCRMLSRDDGRAKQMQKAGGENAALLPPSMAEAAREMLEATAPSDLSSPRPPSLADILAKSDAEVELKKPLLLYALLCRYFFRPLLTIFLCTALHAQAEQAQLRRPPVSFPWREIPAMKVASHEAWSQLPPPYLLPRSEEGVVASNHGQYSTFGIDFGDHHQPGRTRGRDSGLVSDKSELPFPVLTPSTQHSKERGRAKIQEGGQKDITRRSYRVDNRSAVDQPDSSTSVVGRSSAPMYTIKLANASSIVHLRTRRSVLTNCITYMRWCVKRGARREFLAGSVERHFVRRRVFRAWKRECVERREEMRRVYVRCRRNRCRYSMRRAWRSWNQIIELQVRIQYALSHFLSLCLLRLE